MVSTLYLVSADADRQAVGFARATGFLFPGERREHPVTAGHPDLLLLAPAPNKQTVGIDQVRDVVRSMHFAPDNADRRVCLIPFAEALTPQAANALLKAIEEPPLNALFVLLATHAAALPPTIVSRLRVERVVPSADELVRERGSEVDRDQDAAPQETRDAALASMDDADLVALACDDPTPSSRRSAVHGVLSRAASGAGRRRYAVVITGVIAARGREAVAQFVEDSLRVLAEQLRGAWSGADGADPRALLRLCLAAREARRGCGRYAPHDAVLLSFLLTAAGGVRG